MRLPIRAKLTLAFMVMMAGLLAIGGVILFLRFRTDLMQSVDAGLRSRGQAIIGELRRSAPLTAGILIEKDEAFAQILGRDGSVIDSSPGLSDRPVVSAAELGDLGDLRQQRFATVQVRAANDLVPARVLAVPFDRHSIVVVGASLEDRREALARLARMLAIGGPVTVALAGFVGWLVAGLALRPVERMRSQAAAISADDLDRRLPVPPTRDELARLAETLNVMLRRLGVALERERRFVADASHELRTPLTNLKVELELSLARSRTESELQHALRSAGEETDRLIRLAEDLLVLARSEAQRPTIDRQLTDVERIIRDEIRSFAPTAAQRGCAIRSDMVIDGPVCVDPARWRRIVANLLDNATRHGPEDSEVTVSARVDDGTLVLEVADQGEGFPASFLGHAFEPFARAEASRSRAAGGTGLGLAIVRALAEEHGGTATARNDPDRGARIVVTVPTA